jgi:hypothetical protein
MGLLKKKVEGAICTFESWQCSSMIEQQNAQGLGSIPSTEKKKGGEFKEEGSGRVTQVVEHLPFKCEDLSSNASTTKKKCSFV